MVGADPEGVKMGKDPYSGEAARRVVRNWAALSIMMAAMLLAGETGRAQMSNEPGEQYLWATLAAIVQDQGMSTAPALVKFREGNFEQALEGFNERAEQGRPESQALSGMMYFVGLGTLPNRPKAMVNLQRAAEQGNVHAQGFLGGVYAWGNSGYYDLAIAYKWLTLAGVRGYPEAMRARGEIGSRLSVEQLAQADLQVRSWKPHLEK
jgi:TPR repeat protein